MIDFQFLWDFVPPLFFGLLVLFIGLFGKDVGWGSRPGGGSRTGYVGRGQGRPKIIVWLARAWSIAIGLALLWRAADVWRTGGK